MGDSLTDPFVGFVFPWQIWVRRVGRAGYKTVNLGVGGETTGDMRERIEEFVSEGRPDAAVLFAGHCDLELGVDPAETERNITFMLEWLREQGVGKLALIGPGLLNLEQVPEWLAHIPDWSASADALRTMIRDIAVRHDAVFVDLAAFLRERIEHGADPDFSHVPYRQARSWHAGPRDNHFNAYGNRLVAGAVLSATAHWRPARMSRRALPIPGRWRARPEPRPT